MTDEFKSSHAEGMMGKLNIENPMQEALPSDQSAHSAYWSQRLLAAPSESALITDFIRPVPYQCDLKSISLSIPQQLSRKIINLSKHSDSAAYALTLAVTQILLSRYSGNDDVIVGASCIGNSRGIFPFRVVLDEQQSFDDLYQEVIASLNRDSQKVCCTSTLLSALNVTESDNRCTLFDLLVLLENRSEDVTIASLRCDMALRMSIERDAITGALEYNSLLFQEESMLALTSRFMMVLACVADDPSIKLANIPFISQEEQQRVIYEFNSNTQSFPIDKTLSQLIEEQAADSANAIAAIHEDRQLSYQELNTRANQLANLLRQAGVRSGSFVAILQTRGLDFVTAILAIWKAGGAYIPVDPNYPEDRIGYMLSNSEVAVVITSGELLKRFSANLNQCMQLKVVVCLDTDQVVADESLITYKFTVLDDQQIKQCASANLSSSSTSRDPAYMIYTSGSTGLPKGAIIRHDGAVNHIYAELQSLQINGAFRFLQSAPSSLDISVWQFVAPLVVGGATVIIDNVSDVEKMFTLLKQHRVNLLEIVPVVMKYFIEFLNELPTEQRQLEDVQWAMVTGESVPIELVNAWLALYPSIGVVNAYGPTEASDDVTQALIRDPLLPCLRTVSIGKPLANLSIYILDENLNPLPIGIPGEICVAGIGVGDGYWKNKEKTQASFVANPFQTRDDNMMYKTGDLGRWLPDGEIEFLGRIDHQIQIRGFRIELGEIESALRQHPAVKEAVVIAQNEEMAEGYLAAYIIAQQGAHIDLQAIREFVSIGLPEHMVPAAMAVLDVLPLMPSGKVDRKALPRLERRSISTTRSFEAPRNEQESKLAEIWRDVLAVEHIGIEDNFFDIGGDSIGAVQIVAKARRVGISLRPQQLFEHPTIATLALAVSNSTLSSEGVPASQDDKAAEYVLAPLSGHDQQRVLEANTNIEEAYLLSPAQQGIFLHCLMSSAKDLYIDQFCYTIKGELDSAVFQAAWQQVMKLNPILRSAVIFRHVPKPMQVVHRQVDLPIAYLDWREFSRHQQEDKMQRYMQADLDRGFTLSTAPLMRLALVRLASKEYRLVWTHHHILLDGWSLTLVLNQVVACYTKLCDKRSIEVDAGRPYRDYVYWLQQKDLLQMKDFWVKMFDGYSAGMTAPKPDVEITSAKERYDCHEWHFSKLQTAHIEAFSRQQRLTMNTVLHAIWALLLGHKTDRSDVVFGSVASGRQAELEGIDSMVGVLISTLPVRIEIPKEMTASAWLMQLQARLVAVRDFEHTPLDSVQRWSGIRREQLPLFDTIFVTSNYPQAINVQSGDKGFVMSPAEFRTVPGYPITVITMPGEQLLLRIVYDVRSYQASTITGLLEQYRELLENLIAHPQWSLSQIMQIS